MTRTQFIKTFLICFVIFFAVVAFAFQYLGFNDPKPSMGYGGSPGHMTPMEIEELGRKHRK